MLTEMSVAGKRGGGRGYSRISAAALWHQGRFACSCTDHSLIDNRAYNTYHNVTHEMEVRP